MGQALSLALGWRVNQTVTATPLLKELTVEGRVTHWSSKNKSNQVQRLVSDYVRCYGGNKAE